MGSQAIIEIQSLMSNFETVTVIIIRVDSKHATASEFHKKQLTQSLVNYWFVPQLSILSRRCHVSHISIVFDRVFACSVVIFVNLTSKVGPRFRR